MEIKSPLYLILLFFIPALILWYKKKGKRHEAPFLISSRKFLSKSIINAGRNKNNFLKFSQIIVILLIIIGLSRPRIVDKITETKVDVIDMILVLDISSSMLADDFKPNRLEAVKKTAINFIDSRQSDRIGIIVFAG